MILLGGCPPIELKVDAAKLARALERARRTLKRTRPVDTRDGRIYSEAEALSMPAEDRQYMRPMVHHPTPEQRARRKVGRNENCPCGSGKKFKRCCMLRMKRAGHVRAGGSNPDT